MPRKKTQSALEKAGRTDSEKEIAKRRSQAAANARYRQKNREDIRVKSKRRMQEKRDNMSEDQRAHANARQRQYNYNYYSINRDEILNKAFKKRTREFLERHEDKDWTDYPLRIRKQKPQECPENSKDLPYTDHNSDLPYRLNHNHDDDLPYPEDGCPACQYTDDVEPKKGTLPTKRAGYIDGNDYLKSVAW
ncbi:hypothetical protein V5O48_013926 [Marasmius crinis-equi]|uniref:BZIP domain-containing protein n=1 Tax=Marasmius crinis-equi TaxID=585013 RepID=A0ABR3EYR6_9AGAR